MRKVGLGLIILASLLTGQILFTQPVSAVNASDFNPGRIIDDEVFYNKDGMSVAEIQTFLNAHVPGCDTQGAGRSGYGNLTRAQYAQQVVGWPGPPYVCLNNYYENPTTGSTSFENGGGAFSGGLSTAQIIYNASQQYGINPKVLLITLRKESLNLFSDSWPMKSQYKYAMGYACPDSGPNYSANCQSSKAGLYNQITFAAWQLRQYYNNMPSFNYAPGRWNTIQYNPDPNCGTKEVFIENKATASLYIYTPYTPNDAALRAYPGEAPCGAYGNRNFWFMWQEWFGSTYGAANVVSDLNISQEPNGTMFTGTRTVSFTIRNFSSSTIDLGQVGVAASSPTGRPDGFLMKSVKLAPYETYVYTDTQSHFNEEGEYRFWIVANNGSTCVYCTDQPGSYTPSIVRSWRVYIQNRPTVTEGLTLSKSRAVVGEEIEATYRVRNNSARPVSLGSMGVSLYDQNGANVGMTMMDSVTIPANAEQTIRSARVLPNLGTYSAAITNHRNGVWSSSFPASASSGVARELTIVAKKPVVLTSTPALSNTSPRIGENVSVTIPITNFSSKSISGGQIGLAVYDPSGRSVGYAMQPFDIAPGETLVYTAPARQFTQKGDYTAQVVQYQNGVWRDYSDVEDPSVKSSFKFTVQANLTIQAVPSFSPGTVRVNSLVAPQFTIRNYAANAVSDGQVGLAVYDPNGVNVGYAMQNLTVAANGTFTYTAPARAFTMPGKYTAWVTHYKNGNWSEYGALEQGVSTSKFTFEVAKQVTLTATPELSVSAPRVGQEVGVTIPIKNHTTTPLNNGTQIGLAVYGPDGQSVGYAMQNLQLAANENFVYSVASRIFTKPGVYSAHLVQLRNSTWSDFVDFENSNVKNNFKFTVLPSLALQAVPVLNPASPRVGQLVAPQFTIRNYAANTVSDGQVGFAVYDPNGVNVGYAMQNLTIAANGTFTYSAPARVFTTPGKYTAWVTHYKNGNWSEYSALEQGVSTSKFTFEVAR